MEQQSEIRKNCRRGNTIYKNLYHSEDSLVEQQTLNNNKEDNMPDILPDEVDRAIKQMKKSKSPGDDGISIDIFKIFRDEIIRALAQLFQNV